MAAKFSKTYYRVEARQLIAQALHERLPATAEAFADMSICLTLREAVLADTLADILEEADKA